MKYLIIDGTRVNDVRVYEDGIVPTVISRWGTGGGNVPIIFTHKQTYIQVGEGISPTLTVGSKGMGMVFPIQDARDIEKAQWGMGVRDDGSPSYTIDTMGVQGVAISEEPIVMPTLTAANNPSRSPQSSEVTAQVEIMERVTSIVRRLTPKECERLQGFPDDWTEGQADSNRYKQMGNAVAVPVVQWIVNNVIGDKNVGI